MKSNIFFPAFSLYCSLFLATVTLIGCSSKEDQDTNDVAVPSASSAVEGTPEVSATKAITAASTTADTNNIASGASIPNRKREFVPAEPVSVAAVVSELGTNIGGERKVELLESLADQAFDEDPNVIEAVQKTISDPNLQVAEAAMELLQTYDSPVILPAVSAAMQNPDADIRQSAIDLLANIDDPQTAGILAQAFDDVDEDVRTAAIDAAGQQNDDVQLALAQTGLDSSYGEIKEASVSMLENVGNKKAVATLINGLKDKSPDFRQNVSDTIESLIEQKFDTYEQAQAWWTQNGGKYDNDLVLQDGDSN